VKESQGLARVLDTLVFAYEFIMLPTPSEQAEGLEALRRTMLRLQPDLKVGPACWSVLLSAFGLLTAFLGSATHYRAIVFCMVRLSQSNCHSNCAEGRSQTGYLSKR
jgi:hypothetical protein